jgi:hypothetical protein
VALGLDHLKFFVPHVMTGWKHKLFAFRGAQEWKNLPSEIWTIQSCILKKEGLVKPATVIAVAASLLQFHYIVHNGDCISYF